MHVCFGLRLLFTLSVAICILLAVSGTPMVESSALREAKEAEKARAGAEQHVKRGSTQHVKPVRASDGNRALSIKPAKPNSAPSSCISPPAGLVAWWPFDAAGSPASTTPDIQGFNDASLFGGTSFSAGEVSNALQLSSGAYAMAPGSPGSALDVGSSAAGLTIDAWINPTSLSLAPIVEWDDNLGNSGVHLFVSISMPGTLYANLVDTSGNSHIIESTGAVITPGTYQHVALTYDATPGGTGDATLYVNGAPIAASSLGVFTPQTSYDLYFGLRPGAYQYAGAMDEVELFNTPLTATDISNIFAAGSAGKCKPVCTAPPGNMVNWYPGDGDFRDVIGGADGTPDSPGTVAFQVGEVGQAFSFNGTDAAITANSNTMSLALPITIDAWVNPALRNDGVSFPSNAVSNDDPGNFGLGFGVNVFPGNSQMTVEYNGGFAHPVVTFNAGQ